MAVAERLLTPEALRRLANLNLVSRWVVEGFISGLHRSPFHGFSVEFAEYRQYVPGDDLRFLDWAAYGKSDRYYVKKFHSETNLKAHLLLDTSASMGYTSGGPTKLRYGACLAASLARLMTRQQDAAGLVTFSDKILKFLSPKASPRHLRDLMTVLEAATPRAETKTGETLHALAESVKRRGLIVLISDLLDDPEVVLKGLKHFRHKKHEVIVFHVLDPAEVEFPFEGLADFKDMETGKKLQVLPLAVREAYLKAVGDFVARFKKGCNEALIDYQLALTSTPFDAFLARYLHKRARVG